jgi:HEAT repeat protein
MLQSEAVRALGKLNAVETVTALLDLLTDDELYGPRSGVYHAVTEAFQMFGSIIDEIKDAFPGNYPPMFNMGGAPLSLPETMGLLGSQQPNPLLDALARFHSRFDAPAKSEDPKMNAMRKTLDDLAWKFGVMFADARDASQDRVSRLMKLLASENALTRSAAALTLPWYGDERSLEALKQLAVDTDEKVQTAAVWAIHSLQKIVLYRRQSGM